MVQAVGHIPIDVNKLNIDLLSLSGHKFQGPKGWEVLYIKTGTKIETLIHGGGQERKRRAGIENVPAIIGLGQTIELATGEIEESNKILLEMRNNLIKGLIKISKTHLNGHPTQRLANNVNVTFEYMEGESLLLMLNTKGIFASAGSACNSSSLETSHVLTTCGVPPEIIRGSLKLSLGMMNTTKDVDRVLEILSEIVQKLRNMSSLKPHEYRTI